MKGCVGLTVKFTVKFESFTAVKVLPQAASK